MTGREHVQLYAAIKGVPKEFVNDAVAHKLGEVGLSEFDSDRLSSGYSGGMKRKLSVACATIGQPQMVFLDEPSTGKGARFYMILSYVFTSTFSLWQSNRSQVWTQLLVGTFGL